jgi:uncharacterized membrane protein YsdA (DUF1294 family)
MTSHHTNRRRSRPARTSRSYRRRISPYRLSGGIALVAFVALLGWLTASVDWPLYLTWPAVLAPITFLFYWFDKHQSRGDGMRIPERVLLLLSLGGGFAGGFLGMLLVRHKTKEHPEFWAAQWGGLALWIGVVWWLTGGG